MSVTPWFSTPPERRRTFPKGRLSAPAVTVYEPLTTYGEYSALEFRALVEYGMSTAEAITAATVTASQAVGMSHLICSVEPGKLADLLVLRRDPTVDPMVVYDVANIYLTFCDGKLTVVDGLLAW